MPKILVKDWQTLALAVLAFTTVFFSLVALAGIISSTLKIALLFLSVVGLIGYLLIMFWRDMLDSIEIR